MSPDDAQHRLSAHSGLDLAANAMVPDRQSGRLYADFIGT
jgi:hypothetical protein